MTYFDTPLSTAASAIENPDGPANTGLDLTRLDGASDEEVHAALTAINGIGPWTADIFLMFCLGRADAWAPGDLALQLAAQTAFELEEKPDKLQLLELAERWRPWRWRHEDLGMRLRGRGCRQ